MTETHAVVLSAAGPDPLRRLAESLRDHAARADPAQPVTDVAWTTQVGRTPLTHRLAVCCRDHGELRAALTAYLDGRPHETLRQGTAVGAGLTAAGPPPETEGDAAAAWVAGAAIDWRRYWPAPGRRVSLPTYPFGSTERPAEPARPAPADAATVDYLTRVYTEESGVTGVDPFVPLTDQGLSSFVIARLNARLERDLGERSRTLFFEHATLAQVAGAMAAAVPATTAAGPAPVAGAEPDGDDEIAVVGIAGRYPRSADLAAFWDNLVHGRDCVTPHPVDRARPGWPVDLMEGGYLDQVDRFDPLLFGITPRDAALMDPQERLMLEVTWEALESAGYTRARLRERHHSAVAVYAGAMWNEYPLFGAERSLLGEPQDSGATLGGIANRVSYFFDLHGPSLTVDTMCSSALVALDLAVKCLRRGEAEVAISGAVSLSLHPNKFRQQHRMTLTATHRRSRSFGAGGDGFVPSEGVGVLILKPLRRALADGDPVHAVIRGTAVVHAGRTNGYIVPSPAAQAEVISRALRDARTEPAGVGYVEAHGAGTALGDPVEIDGLTRAYGDLPPGAVPIGSVKSTIGHTEAAAGLAGLTKVVLQMRHGTLAPSLHADELNPNIDWATVPFRVQRAAESWDGPRVAGISSFGAGGTIAHAVVAAPPQRPPAPPADGPQIILLSSYDEERLDRMAARLAERLRGRDAADPDRMMAVLRRIASGELSDAAAHAAAVVGGGGPALADVAYTLQVGREALRERLAVVVDDLDEARTALENWRTDPRVLRGRAPAATDPDGPRPPAGAAPAEVAAHWVAGGAVDWERRHAPGRSVVDLPSYPFARMRCWVPEAADETPLLEKVWVPDPGPAPGPAGSGAVLCVGGTPEAVAALGAIAVGDEDGLARVLAGTPDIAGLVDLPGGPDWADRVAVLRRLLTDRPRAALRVVHVAGADVRTAGFVKMLGAEYARVTATVLHDDDPAALAARIRAEWDRPDPYGEVRYRGGVRHRPALVPVDAPYTPLVCDPRGAYLVTGGTRGTGALVARHLAAHGARAVALVGVRDRDDTARELTARGVRVLRHSGGFAGIAGFLDRVRAELGPLRGIVHCAGVAGHGSPAFVGKDLAGIRAVLAPKLDALEQLSELCAGDRLDFAVVFSSVCATVPSLAAGVSDYAAANAAADDLVRAHLAAGRTAFRSVDWPQWAQTGSTRDLPNPCAPAGIAPLDDAAGLRVLDRVLALSPGRVVLPCPPLGAPPDPDTLLRVRPGAPPGPRAPSAPALGSTGAGSSGAGSSGPGSSGPGSSGPGSFGPGSPGRDAPSGGDAAARPVEPAPPTPRTVPSWLTGLFSQALGIPVHDLDPTADFGDLGVDSVLLGELLIRIEERLGRSLDPATLLLHPTVDRLAAHLDLEPEPSPEPPPEPGPEPPPRPEPIPDPAPVTAPDPRTPPTAATTTPVPAPAVTGPDGRIAVIGLAVRFPGATDPDTLWDNLMAGRCTITEVPASRWDHRRWYSPEPALGRSISRWGGFVDGLEQFDPAWFDMTDDEARCLDPAIRMVLEATAEVFADAGYDPAELRGRRVAVTAGARLGEYGRRVPARGDVLRSDQNFITARVAHRFDLRGPNTVVDSACSSSLLAVQAACRSLLAGEAELAVAGGVEVLLDEHAYLDLSAARALSPTGRCWTFDERADGFVPAEGCAVVLLKPLGAALADGDRIRAVIEGVAVNNDGHTMGVTTPSPAAQADVVRRALAVAGRTPADVALLEAHGTGTVIGDPIELRALNEVFQGRPPGSIRIGSVKSNLGHLLSAAGMAGLAKVILALEHGRIPPTLFCDRPNPRFDFAHSPLRPVTAAAEWPAGAPRVAGVSSFGLGGTNAHAVLSAAPSAPARRTPLPRPVFRRRRLWLDAPASLPEPERPQPERPQSERPAPARPVPAQPAAEPRRPLVASLLGMRLATRD